MKEGPLPVQCYLLILLCGDRTQNDEYLLMHVKYCKSNFTIVCIDMSFVSGIILSFRCFKNFYQIEVHVFVSVDHLLMKGREKNERNE